MASTAMAPSIQRLKLALEKNFPKVVENYDYLAASASGRSSHAARVDVAAFLVADQLDTSTIAMAANYYPQLQVENPLRNGVGSLAPPVFLSVTSEEVQWWVRHETAPLYITNIDDIEEAFYLHRRLLDELKLAQQGFQTSLFALLPNALDFAREATSKVVIQRFKSALAATYNQDKPDLHKLAFVALDLLTAIIIDDKRSQLGHLETRQAFTPGEALARARLHFPHSFDKDIRVSEETLSTLWSYLREDMTYRSMTPDQLSDLISQMFEQVLLDSGLQHLQGSFYTPRELASRVLKQLPIEEIPPDDRIVLDGSCGSGNLLRAASSRLSDLLPIGMSKEQRASYVSARLYGVDDDPLAVSLARKGLLISNLYVDQQWNVVTQDFLDKSRPVVKEPTLIIANPPFGADANGNERSIHFLRTYLELLRPDGLLGIFLPASLLQNSDASSTALRHLILNEYSLLEWWNLPERTIPSSASAIAVLLIKKCPPGRRAARVYIVDKRNQVEAFVKGETVSQAYAVDPSLWKQQPYARIQSPGLSDVWNTLEQRFSTLGSMYGRIEGGVQPFANKGQLSDVPQLDYRQVLNEAKVLDPYCIRWDLQTKNRYIYYPSDPKDKLRRSKNPDDFKAGEKLVIQGQRWAGSPWRLVSAIDNERLVIHENFHYILPGPRSLLVLTAILNSSLANAWYSEREIQRNIRQRELANLPIPPISPTGEAEIEAMVDAISDLKKDLWGKVATNHLAWQKVRDLTLSLDAQIYDLYGLSTEDRLRIAQVMSRGRRPGVEWEGSLGVNADGTFLKPREHVLLHSTAGTVLEVEPKSGMITVELPGVSRLPLRFQIPSTLPGSALKAGMDIVADIPLSQINAIQVASDTQVLDDAITLSQIDLYNVQLPRLAYLTDDELWNYNSVSLTN